jgi:hypothetical protein
MHESTPPPDNAAASDGGDPSVDDPGNWGLDLWNGRAWFSNWFVERLHWTGHEHKRLDDLRPHLPGGAWESLLAAIRNHLERQTPLDLMICAKLADGRAEWWHVKGAAEHNAGGQPVYLSGNVREVSGAQRHAAAGDEP